MSNSNNFQFHITDNNYIMLIDQDNTENKQKTATNKTNYLDVTLRLVCTIIIDDCYQNSYGLISILFSLASILKNQYCKLIVSHKFFTINNITI